MPSNAIRGFGQMRHIVFAILAGSEKSEISAKGRRSLQFLRHV